MATTYGSEVCMGEYKIFGLDAVSGSWCVDVEADGQLQSGFEVV